MTRRRSCNAAPFPSVAQPEDVAVLPDSSLAFVLSRSERRISVVDLRRGVLVTHLELAGAPTDMLLKPDGGELYVISPEAHGTPGHQHGDARSGGLYGPRLSPHSRRASADASLLYVRTRLAGRVTPGGYFQSAHRARSGEGFPIPAGDAPGRCDSIPPKISAGGKRGLRRLAVIRVRHEFLLTMIPVGSHPQDLAVKLF